MGLIKAAFNAVRGELADQWLEVVEADRMQPTTAMTPGVFVRPDDPRNTNRKGTKQVLSNGSLIHVYDGQFLLLIDGGKIIDYTGEPGYFQVNNTASPSLLHGELGEALKESFQRFRFAGTTPFRQKAVFINTQEIRDLKFGTPQPINYFDSFYNAELYLRAHGSYTIRIVDPIKFYVEVGDRTMDGPIDMNAINDPYRREFLTAFQSVLTQLSVDGVKASHVGAQSEKLAEYLQDALDEKWTTLRGFQIESVAIESISFTEETKKLLNIRSEGAMLSDDAIRRGYMSGAVARGLEAAGANEAGAGQTFMGLGLGLQTGASTLGALGLASPPPQNTPPTAPAASQASGASGAPATWSCPTCGTGNTGKFCTECGTAKPTQQRTCPNCHTPLGNQTPKFCPECGTKLSPDA